MTRSVLTRLILAAGSLVPAGSVAPGQAPAAVRPGTPPRMIWIRPGTPPAGRPATVTELRSPAANPVVKPAEPAPPAPPVAESRPPVGSEAVTWVRPGAPVIPERPPLLVELRQPPARPEVVPVEARAEPAVLRAAAVVPAVPQPMPAPPAGEPDAPVGWRRATAAGARTGSVPQAPAPRPAGTPQP